MARGYKTGGRQAGTPNKVTNEIREAFRNLIELNTDNLKGWLEQVAADDPAKAISLCADLAEFVVPKIARTEHTGADGERLIPDEIKIKLV